MNGGAFDEDDIYNLILQEKMQLWGIHDGDLKAVAVTEIIIYPKIKRLRIVLIGGHEIDFWEALAEKTFNDFAKEKGCSGIEILGRRGWVRRLEKYGYQELETIVVKDKLC